MNKNIFNVLKTFIPLAIVITLFCLLVFWALQQNYRLNANDPQIQMAQDAADYLKDGGPVSFASQSKLEMSKSLSPFLMLYDSNKKLVDYSAVLQGKPAAIPTGALDTAKKLGENKITWQPQRGVRIATVIVYYKGTKEGYALVGRSLKEVEKRIDMLLYGVIATWFITIVLTLISVWYLNNSFNLKLKKSR
jgi:hypothetical protein